MCFFFFFKQKTAYEMRISDWSSDVCSSDLGADDFQILLRALTVAHVAGHLLVLEDLARILAVTRRTVRAVRDGHAVCRAQTAEVPALHRARKALALGAPGDVDIMTSDSSAERRVGEECVSTCRVRGLQDQ